MPRGQQRRNLVGDSISAESAYCYSKLRRKLLSHYKALLSQKEISLILLSRYLPTISGQGHWSQGLYAALEDTSLHEYSDDDLVIIKDKYPKAKYHYLVCIASSMVAGWYLRKQRYPAT